MTSEPLSGVKVDKDQSASGSDRKKGFFLDVGGSVRPVSKSKLALLDAFVS